MHKFRFVIGPFLTVIKKKPCWQRTPTITIISVIVSPFLDVAYYLNSFGLAVPFFVYFAVLQDVKVQSKQLN